MAAPLALDHVALPALDAAATLRFYSHVLGFELVDALSGEGWDGYAWLMMIFEDADGRQLALCAFRGLKRTRERVPMDSRHYALAVASPRAMAAWKKRLAGAAIEFREENHGAQRSIYFEDPSGNILEITSSPSRNHVKRSRGAAARREVERWISATTRPSRAAA